MFKVTNVGNGKTFTHYTKMGMEQDKTILERYGVSFVIDEIDVNGQLECDFDGIS